MSWVVVRVRMTNGDYDYWAFDSEIYAMRVNEEVIASGSKAAMRAAHRLLSGGCKS